MDVADVVSVDARLAKGGNLDVDVARAARLQELRVAYELQVSRVVHAEAVARAGDVAGAAGGLVRLDEVQAAGEDVV